MILIRRGKEPAKLAKVRKAELTKLRLLGRPPTSDEVEGYRIVAGDLWRRQHWKCCYCEQKVTLAYNDVEHYRPKARADRRPGSPTSHGYWWLAFTWSNLLFACPSCNRSNKNDQFPLREGDAPLVAEERTPGRERPLLLDPGAGINPVAHIEYTWEPQRKKWWPRPREGSELGSWTIKVCGLEASDHLELGTDYYVLYVKPIIEELEKALTSGKKADIGELHRRALDLLDPRMAYVGLAFDAIRHRIPDYRLAPWGLTWPTPDRVGIS